MKKIVNGCINLIYKIDMALYTWYIKNRVKAFGKKSRFNGKLTIIEPKNFSIGKNCSLNHNVYINATNPVIIGDNVTISAYAKIISTGININEWIATNEKKHTKNGGIIIGNNIWIGAGAIILENVKITGEFVVVAAGAIVTKDIEEGHCIVAGCPARIIKRLNKQKEE